MPTTKLWGRSWHFSTDILPLPAALAAAFHGPWLVILIVAPAVTGSWPTTCDSWQGVQYAIVFAAFLAAMAVALVIDVLLFYHGLQGVLFLCAPCTLPC